MHDGRARLEWSQTSLLAAIAYNAARGKSPMKQPFDFDPFAIMEKRKKQVGVDFSELKKVFGNRRREKKP